jgi:uracil phosphoribosyltransferase
MSASIHVVDHPLVAHRLGELRSASTEQRSFGRLAHEITVLLAVEAFRTMPLSEVLIDTPVARGVPASRISEEVLLIPFLRAGLGLVPALQETLPSTRVCHIGMRRNEETLAAEIYLDALPSRLAGTRVVICDPMLATGGSLIQAANLVKERGAEDITVLCLLASEEGARAFSSAHPDVAVFTAAVDPVLNEHGYIVPGLGDAGDRLFGAPARP